MSAGATIIRRSECPCAPPAGLSAALLDTFYDDWASRDLYWGLAEIVRSNPGGVAAALFKRPSPKIPDFKAGARKEYSFDQMVRIARGLIFGTGIPGLERKIAQSPSSFEGPAEFKFHLYRQGVCLDCPALIDNADRSDEEAWLGQHSLRTLLGLFDQNGEPIPKALREWSARSRLKAVKGKRGTPRRTWLRDVYILHTVAILAYATGKTPTRNDEASLTESPCDAVLDAFEKEGVHLTLKVVLNAWFKENRGPKLLERWRQASNQPQSPEEAAVCGLSQSGY